MCLNFIYCKLSTQQILQHLFKMLEKKKNLNEFRYTPPSPPLSCIYQILNKISSPLLFDKLYSGQVKINDFGLSLVKEEVNKNGEESRDGDGLGSLPWMAPEIIEQDPPTSAADIFRYIRTHFFMHTHAHCQNTSYSP